MKQRLLKTFLLCLLVVGGVSTAWADNTVRYSINNGETWTEAASLSSLSTVLSSATGNVQVEVMADQVLSDRITWSKAYTLTITPTKNITIKGPAGKGWFLANVNNAVLNIGSDTYTITLDGESKKHTAVDIAYKENASTLKLTNVTFKDFDLNSACHLISCPRNQGNANTLILDKISINNCTNPSDAYIYSIRPVNDLINLKGFLNIDENSTGTAIYLTAEYKDATTVNGRIKIDDNDFTASKLLKINWVSINANSVMIAGRPVVIGANATNALKFDLTDETHGLVKHASKGDVVITQAYTLPVTSAGAATLVLPYATTIPSGVSAYKLTHTDRTATITATPVESTIGAGKPVLINAAAGSYKFVSTAYDGTTATGTDPVTDGALTGVYESTTVPATDSYILYYDASNPVGFYKTNGTQTVAANRCYLTATNVPAASRLTIDFDGDATAIEAIEGNTRTVNDGIYYDLQGRRVLNPTKGLYIVNGKKVVIK